MISTLTVRHPETRENREAQTLAPEDRLRLYVLMTMTRACDEMLLRLYKQGKIVGGAYTGRGNEATSVGSAFALHKEDYLFPMHRDLGAHLVRGQSLRNIFLQHLGRRPGLTRGRDGTGHSADPALRIYGNVSHLAAMIPLAVGVALACKIRKEKSVVLNFIGDGGSNVGEFHEGLNMAAVMKLPFVLVLENNQYAYSTPVNKQFAGESFASRAAGYGIPGVRIDGTDVMAVWEVTKQAVDRAREGGGPTLIESVTMRLQGHSASDEASYVPQELLERWSARDPIESYEQKLVESGLLTASRKEEIKDEVMHSIEKAVKEAEKEPFPDGEEAGEGVYAL